MVDLPFELLLIIYHFLGYSEQIAWHQTCQQFQKIWSLHPNIQIHRHFINIGEFKLIINQSNIIKCIQKFGVLIPNDESTKSRILRISENEIINLFSIQHKISPICSNSRFVGPNRYQMFNPYV